MPFDYSNIFGTIIGISFFSEKNSEGMIFGTLIIIFSGIKLIKIILITIVTKEIIIKTIAVTNVFRITFLT